MAGVRIHRGSQSRPAIRRRNLSLRAVVGQAAGEPLTLDLRSQGPHALVGGTTGAGKSEFLQSWVLGMAAGYSPDTLTFLFVDYKGGAAFAECIGLPHSVGMVTDLSPHLVRRALTSLNAELRYREHILNAKKAKDLLELQRRGDPEAPPSLVIVVDEFAALVQEVPEFVDGVVNVAQRGRSLGLHLILATQRPAGVIKDNLRANTNLRVALRMADEADSMDVLGSPLAADFSPDIPGRGAAKTGPGRITGFQTGYVGGWTGRGAERPSWNCTNWPSAPAGVWEEPSERAGRPTPTWGPPTSPGWSPPSPRRPAGRSCPTPRRPWLPELAATYDLQFLRQRTRPRAGPRRDGRPGAAGAADRVLPAGRRRQHGGLRHRWIRQVDACLRTLGHRGRNHAALRDRARCTGWTSAPPACGCSSRCRMSGRSSPATTASESSG